MSSEPMTAKQQVDAILRVALSGRDGRDRDTKYRTDDGYVRWGLVQQDIVEILNTLTAENAALRERLAEVQRRVTEQCEPKVMGGNVWRWQRCPVCDSTWIDGEIGEHKSGCVVAECLAALATAEGEAK